MLVSIICSLQLCVVYCAVASTTDAICSRDFSPLTVKPSISDALCYVYTSVKIVCLVRSTNTYHCPKYASYIYTEEGSQHIR